MSEIIGILSFTRVTLACLLVLPASMHAGPYSPGRGGAAETAFADAGVPGFVGPHGEGAARLDNGGGSFSNPDNYVNPAFFGWAASIPAPDYFPSDVPGAQLTLGFANPINATGIVTGNNFHIVSLGDMDTSEISMHLADPSTYPLASLEIELERPIKNLSGADFAIFENGFISNYTTAQSSVAGRMFAELGYVEVSSDGTTFARFPSDYLNAAPTGSQAYLSQDVSNIYNLFGKHQNAYGESWGTPFDLDDLLDHPLVTIGTVNLENITCIRVVDIPGDGSFKDSSGNSIYDAWLTFGSGGSDIEAIGAISAPMIFSDWPQLKTISDTSLRDADDDPDHDGLCNLKEYAFALLPWKADKLPPVSIDFVTVDGGDRFAEFQFRRDERLTDLTYNIWVSSDLMSWDLIASSQGGSKTQPVSPFDPQISEVNAAGYDPVAVVRLVNVRDIVSVSSAPRFCTIEIIRDSPD